MTTDAQNFDPATPPATSPPVLGTRIAAAIALILALKGVALATYLVREHINVTEGGLIEGLFCGGGAAFDCNAVAASEHAWLLGLPVALWGLVFYIAMGGLALATLLFRPAERAAAASLGVLAACVALVLDAYLAWLMVARIGSVCLICVASYVINLLLAGVFWWIERRTAVPRDTRSLFLTWRPLVAKLVAAVLVFGGIGSALFLTVRALQDVDAFAEEEAHEFLVKLDQPPEIDMGRFEGQPSRGPANAPITLVLAGDFQCNYCRALSAHAEQLREEMPDQLRVVFLNAPVSSDCNPAVKTDWHEDACWLAEVGECAAEQGKFWEYHDLLFRTLPHPEVNQESVMSLLGSIGLDVPRFQRCLKNGSGRSALDHDVALALELKLESVPSIVLNGHVRRGGVYPKMLRNVVLAMVRNPPAAR